MCAGADFGVGAALRSLLTPPGFPLLNSSVSWLLWQLADSAFPAGGFAHSGGLEAAWQQGEIRSRSDLAGFLEANLNQLGHGALPFVNEAHAAPERLAELDQWADAFLSNHVVHRASRLQGQAWLTATERSFPGPALTAVYNQVRDQGLSGHFAPIFGVVLRLLEVRRTEAIQLFLFLALRGGIASAVRLGIIGPLEAQATQFRLAPYAAEMARCGERLTLADVAQTAPILDLLHGAHDRLYSRLFQT